MRINELEHIAKEVRKDIFQMAYCAQGGHIAPALSIVDILTVLYFEVLNINPRHSNAVNRDRFILSKGHACAALYATLARRGFFKRELLKKFCQPSSILGGHPEACLIPGVEASTGSLGHGLSFGTGIAYAAKLDKKRYHVFVLVGDGECQEGSVWEAALFAAHHGLNNLTVIVDYNKLQALDTIDNILTLEPLHDKWKAFGWCVKQVNGHDIRAVRSVFSKVPFSKKRPNLIIAHTIKGKGISFMENVPIWHYRLPKDEELEQAMHELGISAEELALQKT